MAKRLELFLVKDEDKFVALLFQEAVRLNRQKVGQEVTVSPHSIVDLGSDSSGEHRYELGMSFEGKTNYHDSQIKLNWVYSHGREDGEHNPMEYVQRQLDNLRGKAEGKPYFMAARQEGNTLRARYQTVSERDAHKATTLEREKAFREGKLFL